MCTMLKWGFPGGASGKNLLASAGDVRDVDSIPGSGRSPGGGHGNPLHYSCLESPIDSAAWRAMVYRVTESNMSEATEHIRSILKPLGQGSDFFFLSPRDCGPSETQIRGHLTTGFPFAYSVSQEEWG